MKNNWTFAAIGVAVLLGAYFGSYFSLCEIEYVDVAWQPDNPWIIRTYPDEWMVKFYRPAGNVEEWLRNTFVFTKT